MGGAGREVACEYASRGVRLCQNTILGLDHSGVTCGSYTCLRLARLPGVGRGVIVFPRGHLAPCPVRDVTVTDGLRSAAVLGPRQAIFDVYEEGDLVWVHDYHLMRCPFELRALAPKIKVGPSHAEQTGGKGSVA